jgi:hypothetical protein
MKAMGPSNSFWGVQGDKRVIDDRNGTYCGVISPQ